jgi:YD repeat-containing protein
MREISGFMGVDGLRAMLGAVLLACWGAAGGWAQPSPRVDFETGGILADWVAEAPFVAEAALVHDGRLHLGRLDGGALVTASIAVTVDGPAGGEWTRGRVESDVLGDARAVHAAGGAWFVASGDGRALRRLPAGQEALAAPEVLEVPLEAIDDVDVRRGVLFVLGRKEGKSWLLGRRADRPVREGGWLSGQPLPEERIGGVVMTTDAYVLAGGGEAHIQGHRIAPATIYRAEYDGEGKPTSWTLVGRRLPDGIGPVRAAETNELFAVVPRTPQVGDSSTSQSVTIAFLREGQYLSAWRPIPVQMPPTRDPIIATNPATHQVILTGGVVVGTDEPNRQVRVFTFPATPGLVRQQVNQTATGPAAGSRLATDYRAGLVRALNQERFHVVFLLDDGPASETLRTRVHTNRSMWVMLEDCILSRVAEADRGEVMRLFGVSGLPAVGLLTFDGRPVGAFEGVPDNQQLYELLRPMWEPVGVR